MPLDPGMAKSLAILARSVIFFSFSSARLMLIVFISLIQLKISLKLRPGLPQRRTPGRHNSFSGRVSQTGKSGSDTKPIKLVHGCCEYSCAPQQKESMFLVREANLGAGEPIFPQLVNCGWLSESVSNFAATSGTSPG